MLTCSRKAFASLLCAALCYRPESARAAGAPSVAFVPLDDRPVTAQLPVMLGRIAGQPLLLPPRASIGSYLEAGRPEEILRWLHSDQTAGVSALVASTDMIAYGGLVASRIPGVGPDEAVARLRSLAAFKGERPGAFVAAFGTIMRLAPTGVPKLGLASNYYATGETVDLITQYANLPDPPQTDEQRAYAARLRERIGPATLDAYLATRARNRYVDEYALQFAAEGGIDRIVLGQDDAGPTGLHLHDIAALSALVKRFFLENRASIEPGADELGMAMLAAVFARNVGWKPMVSVIYFQSDGQSYQDPLEFAPIGVTIGHLIRLCGARQVDTGGDIRLYVRLPEPAARNEDAFEAAIADDVKAGRSVAVADLSFLHGRPGEDQQQLANNLIADGIAGKIDAFASWNTTANTVGTALAAAIAAGAGRRGGRYNARAHAEFMLDRYIDDYAFHQFVRPAINEELRARGIDTTLLTPDVALEASHQNRAQLWQYSLDLLARIYPEYSDRGMTITLPWDRTFETQIDVRL
jgi:hypothetical protein